MYAAVDIGGTKTLVAVFDNHGKIIEQVKFPTPKDYEVFKKDLAKVVANLSTSDFQNIVVAVPGKLDRKNGIALAFGNRPWKNVPIEHDIEFIFKAPIIIENDSKLAALAEANNIDGKYRKVFYLTVSTGINGGMVIDGKIDINYEDMEVGQIPIDNHGVFVDWEDFGSGRSFQEKFGMRVSDMPIDNYVAWEWFAQRIGVGLLHILAILTPELVIIGGGAGEHLEKFEKQLLDFLKSHENPMFSIPPIKKAKYGGMSVAQGCFQLAKFHHEKLIK